MREFLNRPASPVLRVVTAAVAAVVVLLVVLFGAPVAFAAIVDLMVSR